MSNLKEAAQGVLDAWEAGVIGHTLHPEEAELYELQTALVNEPEWEPLVRKYRDALKALESWQNLTPTEVRKVAGQGIFLYRKVEEKQAALFAALGDE